MLEWLAANSGTILVTVLLAALVTMIILYMRKEKKKGGVSCGCDCSRCAMCGACHLKKAMRNHHYKI